MKFNIEDTHVVNYSIEITQSTIDILKKEFKEDVLKGASYYDSFEDCLYDFLNDLYEQTYTFIENGYDKKYNIKINTFEDWYTKDDGVDIEEVVNFITETGKLPE